MRAQAIIHHSQEQKGLVTSHMRSTNKERVETNHGEKLGEKKGQNEGGKRGGQNQFWAPISLPFQFGASMFLTFFLFFFA